MVIYITKLHIKPLQVATLYPVPTVFLISNQRLVIAGGLA